MNFEEHRSQAALSVESYENGCLRINSCDYRTPVVLGGDRVFPLDAASIDDLQADSFRDALADGAEVILLGTGEKQRFIHPRTVAALAAQGVGLECMNTAAACRTLMLLQSEGRKVWAWLWV